jgi:PAS domain S-box-containing protein
MISQNNKRNLYVSNQLLTFLIFFFVAAIFIQPVIYPQQNTEQLSTKEKLLNLIKETETKESKKDIGIKKISGPKVPKTNVISNDGKINTKSIDETSPRKNDQTIVTQESPKNNSSPTGSSSKITREENQSTGNEFPFLTIAVICGIFLSTITLIIKWRKTNMKNRIKRFKDWGIATKIISVAIVSTVLFALVVVFYFLPSFADQMRNNKIEITKNLVEVAHSLINEYENRVNSGQLTLEDAQKQAIEKVHDLRFDASNYFWINDLSPKMIMHPFKPELNGKDISGNKDPDGKLFFMEMVKICQEKGEGLVDYKWPKPGVDKPVPKISYVKLNKSWGWIVGCGIYVDDIDVAVAAVRNQILLGFGLAAFFSLLIAFFMGRYIGKPVKILTETANKVAGGELNVTVENNSKDEIGSLSRSFNIMIDKISQQIQYLDNLSTPVMVINKEFSIQYMNKTGATILGKTQQELVGQKCYDNFKTGDCKTDKCACAQAMKNNMTKTEETIANPNGKTLPIQYTGAPIMDKSGETIGAVEFVTDITSIKEAQNYLARSTSSLLVEMDKFADGDLTVEVVPEKENDDIGKLFYGFNKSVQNIKEIVENVIAAV